MFSSLRVNLNFWQAEKNPRDHLQPQGLFQALSGLLSFHLAFILGHRPVGCQVKAWGVYLDPTLGELRTPGCVSVPRTAGACSASGLLHQAPLGSSDFSMCSTCPPCLTCLLELAQAPGHRLLLAFVSILLPALELAMALREKAEGCWPHLRMLPLSSDFSPSSSGCFDWSASSSLSLWSFLVFVGC